MLRLRRLLLLRHQSRGVRLIRRERVHRGRGSLRLFNGLSRGLSLLRGWCLNLGLGALGRRLGGERAEAEEELGGFVVLVVQRRLPRLGPRRRRLRRLRRL